MIICLDTQNFKEYITPIMPPDIIPGGGATRKDAITRIPDREANIATLGRIIGFVEMESTNLEGRPDSELAVSTIPGLYWTIQIQRGKLPGFSADTPSITATYNSTAENGLPIESIRADVIQMFGTRVGGIHLYPRTDGRSWDEHADVTRLAELADAYSLQSLKATEKAVSDAAELARAELHGMTGTHNAKWAIEVKLDMDHVAIWETRNRATERLIIASPASEELPDGTPARPARITVQDLRKGTIVNEGRAPIRDLRRAMKLIFPNRPIIDSEQSYA